MAAVLLNPDLRFFAAHTKSPEDIVVAIAGNSLLRLLPEYGPIF